MSASILRLDAQLKWFFVLGFFTPHRNTTPHNNNRCARVSVDTPIKLKIFLFWTNLLGLEIAFLIYWVTLSRSDIVKVKKSISYKMMLFKMIKIHFPKCSSKRSKFLLQIVTGFWVSDNVLTLIKWVNIFGTVISKSTMHSTQDLVQACDTRAVTEAIKVTTFKSHLSMSGYLFLHGVFRILVHLRVARGWIVDCKKMGRIVEFLRRKGSGKWS